MPFSPLHFPFPMNYSPLHHFLQLSDWPAEKLHACLDLAIRLKTQLAASGCNDPLLAGKTLAMIFEKPSLRTRVSFAVAMTQLGGQGLLLRQDEVGLDTREPTEDVARVLAGMVDGIMIRTFEQARIEKLAHFCQGKATLPVINGLTDLCHPCQAMADVLTLKEHFGTLTGRTLAFIGDGNNVARSLAVACGRFGMKFVLASPEAYCLPRADIDRIMSQVPELDFATTSDPALAARSADCLYTDTWVSMGQEAEKAQRLSDFTGFRVDESLLAQAPGHAVILHCLPAYRGYEISASLIDHPRSLIFPQAHNRLHAQKAILAMLLAS
jgi:ornithine carbamoyltransferase